MTTQTYNGWTNYETWAVKLWIDNDQGDQGDQEYWLERAKEVHGAYELSDMLRTEMQEAMPDLQGVFADLLQAAIGSVNWHEIAEAMMADAKDIDD